MVRPRCAAPTPASLRRARPRWSRRLRSAPSGRRRTRAARVAMGAAGGVPGAARPRGQPDDPGKVALGRHLFYDRRLSGNGTQSCASCHRQELAFTDGRRRRSARPARCTRATPVAGQRRLQLDADVGQPVARDARAPDGGPAVRRPTRSRWASPTATRTGAGAHPRRPLVPARFRRRSPAGSRSPGPTIVQVDRRLPAQPRSPATPATTATCAARAKLTATETRGMDLFIGERAECHHCHGSFNFNDQATYTGAPVEPAVVPQHRALQPRRHRRVPGAQPRRLRVHRQP